MEPLITMDIELTIHADFIGLAFPLIVVEIVLGWYMIKWGAGVHQWQVTYDQLFNQLYVIYHLRKTEDGLSDNNHIVDEYRRSHILSALLPGQDGHPSPILASFRADTTLEQAYVVRIMDLNCGMLLLLHSVHVLDYVLLHSASHDLVQVHPQR
jgi:hypothetical protein